MEEETLIGHRLFKTARFSAVYGFGGFSVGVSKSFRVGFIGPHITHASSYCSASVGCIEILLP